MNLFLKEGLPKYFISALHLKKPLTSKYELSFDPMEWVL